MAALYSVAEHSRALLVALNDGALPSNVGGGYNLRVILRRALAFVDKYGWNLSLPDIAAWHADYLKPLFPELSENLENVKKILDVEKDKYKATRQKTRQIVSQLMDKEITEEKLIGLYDSNGISPELVSEEAKKNGKTVSIPDDFYAKVAERHEKKEQVHATAREEKLDLKGIPETEALYFDDYLMLKDNAEVLKIIGKDVIARAELLLIRQVDARETGQGLEAQLGIVAQEEAEFAQAFDRNHNAGLRALLGEDEALNS